MSLTFAVKSIEGHSGYTTSPKEREAFATIVNSATLVTLALSAALFLPYGINVVREKTRRYADPTERAVALEVELEGRWPWQRAS